MVNVEAQKATTSCPAKIGKQLVLIKRILLTRINRIRKLLIIRY